MTSEGAIRIERTAGVALLTLDNRARRNAISAPMWEALRTFSDNVRDDATLRAVIITGADGAFSAGADISGFEMGRSGRSAKDYDDLVEISLRAIETMPQVVIAAIAGPCVGAGASLACSCDFRIADSDGFFAVPAARLGLGYDPRGIARFVRIFGECGTKEALLLAARIPAARAFALGAVHRLTESGRCLGEARDMAAQAVALAPLTQRAAKFALRELAGAYEPSAPILELTARADTSLDYAEGRAAFAEKRPPKFHGR